MTGLSGLVCLWNWVRPVLCDVCGCRWWFSGGAVRCKICEVRLEREAEERRLRALWVGNPERAALRRELKEEFRRVDRQMGTGVADTRMAIEVAEAQASGELIVFVGDEVERGLGYGKVTEVYGFWSTGFGVHVDWSVYPEDYGGQGYSVRGVVVKSEGRRDLAKYRLMAAEKLSKLKIELAAAEEIRNRRRELWKELGRDAGEAVEWASGQRVYAAVVELDVGDEVAERAGDAWVEGMKDRVTGRTGKVSRMCWRPDLGECELGVHWYGTAGMKDVMSGEVVRLGDRD